MYIVYRIEFCCFYNKLKLSHDLCGFDVCCKLDVCNTKVCLFCSQFPFFYFIFGFNFALADVFMP